MRTSLQRPLGSSSTRGGGDDGAAPPRRNFSPAVPGSLPKGLRRDQSGGAADVHQDLLADGTPDGIRIVEKSNWTGRAVVASRAQLADALKRNEISRPGVYVLVGPGASGGSRIYVGEAAAEATGTKGGEVLTLSQRGAEGKGRETKDGFVVLAGSRARASETKAIHNHLHELRKQLLGKGVLVPDGDHLVLTQDYRFASPSTAAGVLVGSAANGRVAWKTPGGKTLKTVQGELAEAAP